MNNFEEYVASFYFNKTAIYPLIAQGRNWRLDLRNCCDFIKKSPNYQGDSIDREAVRNMLENIGYKEISITDEA